MRPRKWVAVAGLVLVLLATLGWQAVLFLERERNIERFLAEQISPLVDGRFDVKRVRLGFLSAYLSDVHLELPMNSASIRISDIKIGFSLSKLLRGGGDLSSIVSKIILIKPTIELRFVRDSLSSAPTILPDISGNDFPIDFLQISGGAFVVVDVEGNRFALGDDLEGRIAHDSTGVAFTMKGRMASLKRNLVISGHLPRELNRNTLSFRVDQARVLRPISFEGFTIADGILNGAAEFSFGKTLTLDDLDCRGWVSMGSGRCQVFALASPLTGIGVKLSMEGSRFAFDSLVADYRQMRVEGFGTYDIAQQESTAVELRVHGVELSSIADSIPPFLRENLRGAGSVGVQVVRAPSDSLVSARFWANGFSFLSIPVTRLSGRMRLGAKSVTLDSCGLETPGATLAVRGRVGLSGPLPTYDLGVRARVDSLALHPDLKGRFEVVGAIRGSGGQPLFDARVKGSGVSISGIDLGRADLSLSMRDSSLTFATAGDSAAFTARGAVRGIGHENPGIDAVIQIGQATLLDALTRVDSTLVKRVRSLEVEARLSGALERPDIMVTLVADASPLIGRSSISVRFDKNERILFRTVHQGLTVSDTAFPFHISGSYHRNVLAIDSLSLLGGVSGAGRMSFGKKHTDVDAQLVYRGIALPTVGRWFLGKEHPIREGVLWGKTRLFGPADDLRSTSDLHVRNGVVGEFGKLALDAVVSSRRANITVLPMLVRKDSRPLMVLDTLSNDGPFRIAGTFEQVDLLHLMGAQVGTSLRGTVSGSFASSPGFPVKAQIRSRRLQLEKSALDSVELELSFDTVGITIHRMRACDSSRSVITGTASIPYPYLFASPQDSDTLRASILVKGDLLSSIQHNVHSPLGGTGKGEVRATIIGTADSWRVVEGLVLIPKGNLLLEPFIHRRRPEVYCSLRVDDAAKVTGLIRCDMGRRRILITPNHSLPQGFEPLLLGPIDLGMLQVETPDGPVELHFPGYQAIGEVGEFEVSGKRPLSKFALSGPLERVRISGTATVRTAEFTYPLLTDEVLPWDDPFPIITWDMDVRFGNKALYYWALRGKRSELIRLFEGTVDRTSSWVGLRGRDVDGTFSILGLLRSYRGVAYFGKAFDRNVDVGVEFNPRPMRNGRGYDNFPYIWGSAEAFSDTSRYEKVKLTLRVQDPETGALTEKGRIAMVPAAKASFRRGNYDRPQDSLPNFVFHVSSDFENILGESERDFYQQAGLRIANVESAGEFVSDFGERYLHRYFLQRLERRLAKSVGLDVITLETSIASNYFSHLYNREYNQLGNQLNLLANMGLTVGRYFFRDYFFLKARGELVPTDTLLRPEYSLGLEFMPANYFMMDVNYGFHKGEQSLEHGPKVQMQLRLPIQRFRNLFDF